MTSQFLPADDKLQRSTTHRLVHFDGAPGTGYIAVENAVADEVEDLRAFVQFLFPLGGQDRFRLLRPDLMELRWTVFDTVAKRSYVQADTARLAVRNARLRLADETRHNDGTAFELQPQ